MNYRRGLFRVWTVASFCWAVFVAYASFGDRHGFSILGESPYIYIWATEWTTPVVFMWLLLAILPPVIAGMAAVIIFYVLRHTGSWIGRGFTEKN